jgi:hypothetical protein
MLHQSVGVSRFGTNELRAIRNAGLELPVLNAIALQYVSASSA